jgi:hypothetical protein
MVNADIVVLDICNRGCITAESHLLPHRHTSIPYVCFDFLNPKPFRLDDNIGPQSGITQLDRSNTNVIGP